MTHESRRRHVKLDVGPHRGPCPRYPPSSALVALCPGFVNSTRSDHFAKNREPNCHRPLFLLFWGTADYVSTQATAAHRMRKPKAPGLSAHELSSLMPEIPAPHHPNGRPE